MHQHLDVRAGDQLLDIACGSGLALELARARGAAVSGVDASARLVAIARDRVPEADIRVGDMAALPWADGSFDVVTSFRGLWATTRKALAETFRVLSPGGRISLTTWGNVKASSGLWALTPFTLAAEDEVRSQAEMKSLGRPGVGEEMLAEAGFIDVRRHSVAFAWEFPDPQAYARMLASTGPAYQAIQSVGEEEFYRYCVEVASRHVREGLPLRAEIDCVGFTAKAPIAPGPLLGEVTETDEGRALAAEDLEDLGFVTNATKLWVHDPAACEELFTLIDSTARAAGISIPERGVATVVGATLTGDPYCSLAWGNKLAEETTAEMAASVLRGSGQLLDERGRAVAAWTRRVASAPRSTTTADVDRLLSVGFDRAQVLRLTLFITLRIAFSTVNGALGARPEQEYAEVVDPAVRDAWESRVRFVTSPLSRCLTEQRRSDADWRRGYRVLRGDGRQGCEGPVTQLKATRRSTGGTVTAIASFRLVPPTWPTAQRGPPRLTDLLVRSNEGTLERVELAEATPARSPPPEKMRGRDESLRPCAPDRSVVAYGSSGDPLGRRRDEDVQASRGGQPRRTRGAARPSGSPAQ